MRLLGLDTWLGARQLFGRCVHESCTRGGNHHAYTQREPCVANRPDRQAYLRISSSPPHPLMG
jgi:hypothetical protein